MQIEGYKKLIIWKNLCYLRRRIYMVTERFRKNHPRLVSQMRDSIRSSKQNIAEGYKKDSLGSFIQSVKISRGSLEELTEDVQDCFDDSLITQKEYDELYGLSKKTMYLIDRFLDSLYKLRKEGRWKTRWEKFKK